MFCVWKRVFRNLLKLYKIFLLINIIGMIYLFIDLLNSSHEKEKLVLSHQKLLDKKDDLSHPEMRSYDVPREESFPLILDVPDESAKQNEVREMQDIVALKPVEAERRDSYDHLDDRDSIFKEIKNELGEEGKPVHVNDKKRNFHSDLNRLEFISDLVALNRSLPDLRHVKCSTQDYPTSLPTVSVVIPFGNEHWSILVRTFTSVLNRAHPAKVLEVILVDDGSTKDFLKDPLDRYVKKYSVVRVLHLPERVGLVRARLAGASEAKGQVLVFLDAHVECSLDWLRPLLAPIVENSRTCVCPLIDIIEKETLEYRIQDNGARGVFDWNMDYKRVPISSEEQRNMPLVFRSPVMAGGLLAISADFFWQLGGYDPELRGWGGEQYELSFKIWMCGGTLVDAPCSRIGHIYGDNHGSYAPIVKGTSVSKNHKRVVEVWMDEYKEYVYKKRPQLKLINEGDTEDRKSLRRRLGCKSFRWYMETVAKDVLKFYPPYDIPDFASGKVRSLFDSSTCVTVTSHSENNELLTPGPCASVPDTFRLTVYKDVRVAGRDSCWDVSGPDLINGGRVVLFPCHRFGGYQLWKYNHETRQLEHKFHKLCLELSVDSDRVYVTTCQVSNKRQRWSLDNVNLDRLSMWDDEDRLFKEPPKRGTGTA